LTSLLHCNIIDDDYHEAGYIFPLAWS